jgi:hypothetical protein
MFFSKFQFNKFTCHPTSSYYMIEMLLLFVNTQSCLLKELDLRSSKISIVTEVVQSFQIRFKSSKRNYLWNKSTYISKWIKQKDYLRRFNYLCMLVSLRHKLIKDSRSILLYIYLCSRRKKCISVDTHVISMINKKQRTQRLIHM